MYAYVTDELVRAITREREEEARQTRPHAENGPKIAPTVTPATVSPASRC
ncbi:hypothetical protein LCGC14_2747840 [marine sediment metagenome]|uniref:Uncharacterized protein n=1 Tax=marine sediment metagenome TaxID=412755 RepID=A0A0F9BUB1_9ZZZZ